MAWVTPITDRVLSDVTTPTSKGRFNVADWTRIYGNAQYVSALLLSHLLISLPFTTITTPTRSTDPTTIVGMVNTLLGDLETIRAWIGTHGGSIPGLTTLTWIAGAATPAPNYLDVNQWENLELLILNWINSISYPRLWICGVDNSVCGTDRDRADDWR